MISPQLQQNLHRSTHVDHASAGPVKHANPLPPSAPSFTGLEQGQTLEYSGLSDNKTTDLLFQISPTNPPSVIRVQISSHDQTEPIEHTINLSDLNTYTPGSDQLLIRIDPEGRLQKAENFIPSMLSQEAYTGFQDRHLLASCSTAEQTTPPNTAPIENIKVTIHTEAVRNQRIIQIPLLKTSIFAQSTEKDITWELIDPLPKHKQPKASTDQEKREEKAALRKEQESPMRNTTEQKKKESNPEATQGVEKTTKTASDTNDTQTDAFAQ